MWPLAEHLTLVLASSNVTTASFFSTLTSASLTPSAVRTTIESFRFLKWTVRQANAATAIWFLPRPECLPLNGNYGLYKAGVNYGVKCRFS